LAIEHPRIVRGGVSIPHCESQRAILVTSDLQSPGVNVPARSNTGTLVLPLIEFFVELEDVGTINVTTISTRIRVTTDDSLDSEFEAPRTTADPLLLKLTNNIARWHPIISRLSVV